MPWSLGNQHLSGARSGLVLFRIGYVSSLFLIMMGMMDCLTTVVGTLYFGTVELNPLIASLVSTNLPAFVLLKLAVTVSVGLIFVLAENALMKTLNKTTRSFSTAYNTLRAAYVAIVLFLGVVVANNIVVIATTI